jgi:hypothetical protein
MYQDNPVVTLHAMQLEFKHAKAWLQFHIRHRDFGMVCEAAQNCEHLQMRIADLTLRLREERDALRSRKAPKIPVPKGWDVVTA